MINRIVGHRGAGVLAPENTIHALRVAHDLGLGYVEFDVRLTEDRVPVISHDNSLIRCANQDRLISDITYADLKDVNIAKHFALADLDERVPTLEEWLIETKKLNLHCQLEFKPNADDKDVLVTIVTEMIDDFYKDAPQEERPLVTSFVADCLADLKKKSKLGYQTGMLVKVEETSKWKKYADESGCDFMHLHALYLTEEIANDVKKYGCRINGFHLNHPELARQAIDRGCERFTCDVPDIFKNIKIGT